MIPDASFPSFSVDGNVFYGIILVARRSEAAAVEIDPLLSRCSFQEHSSSSYRNSKAPACATCLRGRREGKRSHLACFDCRRKRE